MERDVPPMACRWRRRPRSVAPLAQGGRRPPTRRVRDPLRPLADNGAAFTEWYRAPELLLGARHHAPMRGRRGCLLAELALLSPLFFFSCKAEQEEGIPGPPAFSFVCLSLLFACARFLFGGRGIVLSVQAGGEATEKKKERHPFTHTHTCPGASASSWASSASAPWP